MIKKALYVDDEYPNRLIFELTYKDYFEIVSCDSADAAMELLEKEKDIQLVIADMRMPGKNGLEMIREAKPKFPNVIFCLLTGYMITPEIEEALDQKILDHYLIKPVEKEQLLAVIKD